MKFNQAIGISTPKVLLVPYCKHHVAIYHTWMQDPDLQSATASEKLSLEEEYAMQQTWATDQDKLTFIVCLPLTQNLTSNTLRSGEWDGRERMVGDVNLFLFEDDEMEEEEPPAHSSSLDVLPSQTSAPKTTLVGEIELMIARKDLQHQGYGRATLITFMSYVLSSWPDIGQQYSTSKQQDGLLGLAYLRAKINQTNERSIRLFESVGFEKVGSVNYFGEVELRCRRSTGHLMGLEWYEPLKRLQYGNA